MKKMLDRKSNYLKENGHLIFPKYSEIELLEDLVKYQNNGKTLRKFLNHFFKEIRYTALYKRNPDKTSSPYELLNSDELIDDIFHKIDNTKTKGDSQHPFYRDKEPHKRLEKYLSFNCGVASQFDPKHIHQVNNYAINFFKEKRPFIVHDPSSGWGCRLSCNVAIGNHYLSTDPNVELNYYLNEAKNFFNRNCPEILIDLRCLGSEIYIKEWENVCDYSFTSPPYFDLEIYSQDSTQSINIKTNSKNRQEEYQKWIDYFVKPTIANQHKYVINGGFVAINIKNLKEHNLYDDWKQSFENHGGFKLHDELSIDWGARVKNLVVDNKSEYLEKIMIYKVIK